MKIEFGFQANCSELVTYMGARTREEIIAVMRRAQEATGWSWRINNESFFDKLDDLVYVLVPVEHLERLLVIESRKERLGIDAWSFLQIVGPHLPDAVREEFTSFALEINQKSPRVRPLFDFESHVELTDIPPEKLVTKSRYKPWGELSLSHFMADHFKTYGFHFLMDQGTDLPLFPVFHRIRAEFKSPLLGHETLYLWWMAYHLLDKERTKGQLDNLWLLKGTVQEKCIQFERYLPLPGTPPLSKDDRSYLGSELGYELEIITYLGVSTREEVLAAMRKLQEETGWTWRIEGELKKETRKGITRWRYYVLIPFEKLEELLVIKENRPNYPKEIFGVWPDTVIPLWKNKLSPELRKDMLAVRERCLRNVDCLNKYLSLADVPADRLIYISKKDHPDSISLDLWDDFDRRGLNYTTFSLGGDFRSMHRVTKIFGTDCLGHDGGSSWQYEEWLEQSGLEEEE